MFSAFLRRSFLAIITLFMLTFISYAILLKDPLNAQLGVPHFYSGYWFYIDSLLHGNLGISYQGGESLTRTILAVLPPTLELCFTSMLLATLFGIPLGYIGALPEKPWISRTVRATYLVGLSIPIFWLAPILLYFSAIHGWEISAIGQYNLLYDIPTKTGFPLIDMWFVDVPYRVKIIQNVLQHLVLPTLVLCILPMMEITRFIQQRTQSLLTENYIKIALSREASKFNVLTKYILRNSLPQLVSQFPRLFILLITQCMLIEGTLAWPGIGRCLIDAVSQQDYNSISAGVMAIGLCILLVNIFTQILMFILDPFNKKGWYVK